MSPSRSHHMILMWSSSLHHRIACHIRVHQIPLQPITDIGHQVHITGKHAIGHQGYVGHYQSESVSQLRYRVQYILGVGLAIDLGFDSGFKSEAYTRRIGCGLILQYGQWQLTWYIYAPDRMWASDYDLTYDRDADYDYLTEDSSLDMDYVWTLLQT